MLFSSSIPRIITIEKFNFLIPLIMYLPHAGKHSTSKIYCFYAVYIGFVYPWLFRSLIMLKVNILSTSKTVPMFSMH